MRTNDLARFAFGAVRAHRLRSGLTALGIAVGIAAVVLLTSIGKGVQRYVVTEFTQFGTHLIAVTPGKTQTLGVSGALISSVRPLSLEDAEALARLPDVRAQVPVVQGNAEVESRSRSRRTTVYGVGPDVPTVWRLRVTAGRFLPRDDANSPRAFAVLGSKLRDELFGPRNALGERVRVGSDRYRVVGVMEPKGQLLGFDLDDAIYIPAAKALELFNRDGLMEVDLVYQTDSDPEKVVESIRRLLLSRHGYEDFTVTTQEQMLEILGSVIDVLTFAVAALGGVSLLVGAVGILTIMTIAVDERIAEIGLLRALGATRGQVSIIFLMESAVLAGLGGLAGLALGAGLAGALRLGLPALPVHTPWPFALMAQALAVGIGLLAGVAPARRAALLEPVQALRAE